MTSAYRRDHIKGVRNDEFEALSEPARQAIVSAATFFESLGATPTTPVPSAGERLALRRAMARFFIDSGVASARGWI